MDLVLGVSVMGDYGRMALVDAAAGSLIDKYDIDLSSDDAELLVETIINTDQGLTEDGHRLVATRVSAADIVLGNDVRDELARAGLANVTLVAPPDAAASFVRGDAAEAGERTSALLFVSGFTATLSVVDADDAAPHLIAAEPVGEKSPIGAMNKLLDRLAHEDVGAEGVYLVGASEDLAALTAELSSPIPFRATERSVYGVALGAAVAAAEMSGPPIAPAAAHEASAQTPAVMPSVPEMPEPERVEEPVALVTAPPAVVAVAEPIAEEPVLEEVVAEPDSLVVDPTPEPETVAETVAAPVVAAAPPSTTTRNWLVMPKTDAERAAITAAAEAAHEAARAEAAKPKPRVKKKKAPKPNKIVETVDARAPVAASTPVDVPEAPAEAQAERPPWMVLAGSSLAAAVAVVFVLLAAGVAIGIKPTASEQAVRPNESVPGKYLPVMPGQGSAPILDEDGYVPPVVKVSDKAPAAGKSTSGTTGGYPTVASGPGTKIVERPTQDTPPPALALPSGFPTDLRDWVPQGMSDDLSALFPAAADCTPGDSACFLKTTGCQPGDVRCLNAMYVACKTGDPACHNTPIAQPHQVPTTSTSACPGPGACDPPTAVECTTPNDPACAPMPFGVAPGDCPPGVACEPAPIVNPNERLGVTPTPTSSAPPTEASTPTSAPPTSPAPPTAAVIAPEPSPTPTTTVEPAPPSPSPEAVAPTEPAATPTSGPAPVSHLGN